MLDLVKECLKNVHNFYKKRTDLMITNFEMKQFIMRSQLMFESFDNRARHNETQRKYFQTDKGKYSRSKGDAMRRALLKESIGKISKEEKMKIGEFYKNCPQDHEVDHILPLSKGGLHCMSNLQYLTRSENRSKWCKILVEKCS